MSTMASSTLAKPVKGVYADAATSTQTGSDIDTLGFEEAMIIFDTETVTGDETVNLTVEASATTGSGYSAITGAAFTEVDSANDNTMYVGRVRLHGTERYLQVTATQAGSGTATYTVIVVLFNPQYSDSQDVTYSFEV